MAYLALRLALFMRIYEGELPPLVLDESLCQLDEKRAERAITLLGGLTDASVHISQARGRDLRESRGRA